MQKSKPLPDKNGRSYLSSPPHFQITLYKENQYYPHLQPEELKIKTQMANNNKCQSRPLGKDNPLEALPYLHCDRPSSCKLCDKKKNIISTVKYQKTKNSISGHIKTRGCIEIKPVICSWGAATHLQMRKDFAGRGTFWALHQSGWAYHNEHKHNQNKVRPGVCLLRKHREMEENGTPWR